MKSETGTPQQLKQEMLSLKQRVSELETLKNEYGQIEKALRESEKKYKSLVDKSLAGVYIAQNHIFKYCNQRFAELHGFNHAEEIMGKHIKDLIADESWQTVDREVKLRESGKKEFSHYQFIGIKKDGSQFDVEVLGNRIIFQKKPAVQGMLIDITKRKKAEQALYQSEYKFRSLFDLTPHAISVTELKTGRIIDVNNEFCHLMKYSKEEIIGKTVNEINLYSKEEREIFLKKLLTKNEIQGLDMDFFIKDGSVVNTFVFAKVIQFENMKVILAEFIDVTERRQLEAQLKHAQKMEGIGTLAGGIAHDFNNILMGIQGNSNLMLFDIKPDHPHFEKLVSIEKLIENGTYLTKQLLGFASGGKYEVRPTDLNDLIIKTSTIFGRAKKEIIIQKEMQKNIWMVEADQGQIEQVLMNLYVDSWQAMPQGGSLYLDTKNVMIDTNYKKPYKFIPGSYVKISVTDTGIGMDEAILQKIFDPFFTTKARERGTGLGLASAYGIIKNHNGFINVYSEKGKGTTFTVYLPASEKQAVEEIETSTQVQTGNETILLVDDEAVIIEVGGEILKTIGYQVLTAPSGKEALKVYQKEKAKIDLIILDMIMPDLSGSETYDQLKKLNPDVKVLLSSGYSKNGLASEILARGCNGFIQKPFTIIELSHKIREIINS